MVLDLKDIIVIEFSLSQGCFHLQNIETTIAANFQAAMKRQQTDYQVVGVATTYSDANEIIEVLREKFKLDDYKIYNDLNGNMLVK